MKRLALRLLIIAALIGLAIGLRIPFPPAGIWLCGIGGGDFACAGTRP